MQKLLILFGMIVVLGLIPLTDAHPHATIDLMDTHSHAPNNENFHEDFILHTFEDVIISVFDFVKFFLTR